MKKKIVAAIAVSLASLTLSIPTFAGQWLSDANGWWLRNDDGSFPANTWQWVDGNGDGVAECYYFNPQGYCLLNTTTPDNYTVNASGAWTVNGVVQTQATTPVDNQNNQSASNVPAVNLTDLEPVSERYFQKYTNVKTARNALWSKAIGFSLGIFDPDGYVEYYAGGQYSKFEATIAPKQGFEEKAKYVLGIYGDDDNLLDEFEINYKTKPTDISVDISGQEYVKLYVSRENGFSGVVLLKDAQFK